MGHKERRRRQHLQDPLAVASACRLLVLHRPAHDARREPADRLQIRPLVGAQRLGSPALTGERRAHQDATIGERYHEERVGAALSEDRRART